jgi:SAM-dependent methyltransferase
LPTSEHWQIPWIVDLIVRERPTTVLDLGAGYGKYGVLAREYADLTRLDAVDVSPPRYPVYDHVYVGDLRALDRLLPADAPRYDLALFVDAIEHLEKDEAWALLDTLTRRANRVLVATPWGFRPQEVSGQPFETHRSGWYPWEFGARYRLHAWRVFPGHFTRYLRLPRLWQLVVLIGSRDVREVTTPLRAARAAAG